MPVAVPLAAAAIGAIGSGMAANKASSAQDRATRAASLNYQQELQFRKDLYAKYQEMYGPIEQQAINQLKGDNPMGWGLVQGNINKNWADSERKMEQSLGGRPLSASMRQGMLLSKNEALSGAWQRGLLDKYSARAAMARSSPVLSLAGGVASSYGRMGDVNQREADRYGNLAAAGWQQAASSLGNAAKAWALNNGRQPQGVPSYVEPTQPGRLSLMPEQIDQIPMTQRGMDYMSQQGLNQMYDASPGLNGAANTMDASMWSMINPNGNTGNWMETYAPIGQ